MGDYTFKLPDIGEGIAEAEISAWHVAVGDEVAEDDPLVDMLTDKANVELTSPVAGRVSALSGAVGDLIATGAPLVIIATGDAEAAPAAAGSPTEVASAAPAEASAATPEIQCGTEPTTDQPSEASSAPQRAGAQPVQEPVDGLPRPNTLAAPTVRQRAAELGIDLALVHTSNPNGRIRHADLAAYLAYNSGGAMPRSTPPANIGADEVEGIRVVGLRRKIAERMSESKRRIPHFSYVEEVDVTELEALRAQVNQTTTGATRLTLLPFLIRALAGVLPRFPQINARYDDEGGVLHRHSSLHVGVATQTPSGLVVPVIRDAQALDLHRLAAEITRLAAAARDGRASSAELSGSTITISSLGPLGGVSTTPVINHPEVAIVGVNKIIERAVVRDGSIAVRRMMNLSCSFDHRVVDGQDAAEFVQAVRGILEKPAGAFVR